VDIDDARVEHRPGDELSESCEQVQDTFPIGGRRLLVADGPRKETGVAIDVLARVVGVDLTPKLELLLRKLLADGRIELESRAQSRADLLKVLNLKDALACSVKFHDLKGRLENLG